MRLRIVLVAVATLAVGFAVAQVTGQRWLGGGVLVAGGIGAAVLAWRWAGPVRALGAVAVFAVAFVVAHPLGRLIGAWPAVLAVCAASGTIAYALLRPHDKLSAT